MRRLFFMLLIGFMLVSLVGVGLATAHTGDVGVSGGAEADHHDGMMSGFYGGFGLCGYFGY